MGTGLSSQTLQSPRPQPQPCGTAQQKNSCSELLARDREKPLLRVSLACARRALPDHVQEAKGMSATKPCDARWLWHRGRNDPAAHQQPTKALQRAAWGALERGLRAALLPSVRTGPLGHSDTRSEVTECLARAETQAKLQKHLRILSEQPFVQPDLTCPALLPCLPHYTRKIDSKHSRA